MISITKKYSIEIEAKLILTKSDNQSLELIINVIKLALQLALVSIGLIIYGIIDLGRAVISASEKKIQEGQNTLMKGALTTV